MWIAKQMGLKDWTMTASVYGQWMPAADTEADLKAEELWSANSAANTSAIFCPNFPD